jgi:cell wall-associated NlpC family hydrolase
MLTARCLTTLVALSMLSLSGCGGDLGEADAEGALIDTTAQAIVSCSPSTEDYTFNSSISPYTDAFYGGERIARFMNNAYTVTVLGYEDRTLPNGGAAITVTHRWHVRTLATPFSSTMSDADKTAWLRAARQANCDGDKDLLAIAFEYDEGSPDLWLSGKRVAGDADYLSGCDFHDYTCSSWDPVDGSLRTPDPACQVGSVCPASPSDPSVVGKLDCSGFVRMVFGDRNNFEAQLPTYTAKIEPSRFRYPLSTASIPTHLPRKSHDQYRYGSGEKLVPFRIADTPTEAELGTLLPGDLLFFNLDSDNLGALCCDPETPDSHDTCCEQGITHVGIYVGKEDGSSASDPKYRVLNSRSSLFGPTMASTSYLTKTGTGGWNKRLRAARRL